MVPESMSSGLGDNGVASRMTDEGQATAALSDGTAEVVGGPPSKLTISGTGLSFARQISDNLVVRIIRMVMTGGVEPEQSNESRSLGVAAAGSGGRKEALAEFYRRSGPKTNPEKLTTIAVYLHEVADRPSFTPDDLKSQFRAVNEPAPANLPRDFKGAQGKGWIAEEHDQPGQYYVTRSGIDAVTEGFSTDIPKKTKRRRRPPPTPATSEASTNGE